MNGYNCMWRVRSLLVSVMDVRHYRYEMYVLFSNFPYWRELVTTWWRHQMETSYALLAICGGNSPVPGDFPHKGQWRGALVFSLICVWINVWVNNREAGYLRCYHAHYDIIVMNLDLAITGSFVWLESQRNFCSSTSCFGTGSHRITHLYVYPSKLNED